MLAAAHAQDQPVGTVSQIGQSNQISQLSNSIGQVRSEAGPLRIGSKRFTESYVLGELLQRVASRHGPAIHRAGLGNTAILLAALRDGEVDLYPEYTGTIAREILHRDDLTSLTDLQSALRPLGLGLAVPLGFSDAYALALPSALAAARGLHGIGDLAHHPALRLAFSQEFLSRPDGWPALAHAYALESLAPRGMDHGLAYSAVAGGAVDIIDAYTTDARLGRDHLVLLDDPLKIIPAYDAALLYRLGTPSRFPAQWQALLPLENQIDEARMRRANAEVDLDHRSFGEAAAHLLASLPLRPVAGADAGPAGKSETAHTARPGPAITPADSLASATPGNAPSGGADDNVWSRFWQDLLAPDTGLLLYQHLELVFGPVLLACAIGVPLGVLAVRFRGPGQVLLALVSIGQTIPALALLALLIAATGRIGLIPALLALFIYALLPIVGATQTGLSTIDRNLREAAVALGAPWAARTWHIELPASRATVLAGVRTAAVINVGGATLAAFVGAGGLGERIVSGLAVNDPALLLAGAVPTAALALVIQAAFAWLERAWRSDR